MKPSSSNPNPTWRRVVVPTRLRRKNVTDDEILEWARGELHGEEPALGRDIRTGIRNGTIATVDLRPKKPGFFLPDGQFVETFSAQIAVGTDIDTAEATWEQEEHDRTWVDEETTRFNKQMCSESSGIRRHWEHGKRIEEYVAAHKRPPFRIHMLLEERKGKEGYGRRSHEYSSFLYRWKPQALESDPIFEWTWQLVDALLALTDSNIARDAIERIVSTRLVPSGATFGDVAQFLRGETSPPVFPWTGDRVFLADMREKLRLGRELSEADRTRLAAQFSRP